MPVATAPFHLLFKITLPIPWEPLSGFVKASSETQSWTWTRKVTARQWRASRARPTLLHFMKQGVATGRLQEGGDEICFRKMKFGAVCRMNGGLGKAGKSVTASCDLSPGLFSIRVGCFTHNYGWKRSREGLLHISLMTAGMPH